jgi:hypothetical protein
MLKTSPSLLSQIDVPILELRNTALDHYVAVKHVIDQSEAEVLHVTGSCIRTKLNILHGYGEAREGRGYHRRSLPTTYYDKPKKEETKDKPENEETENKHVSGVIVGCPCAVRQIIRVGMQLMSDQNATLVGVASVVTIVAFVPSILAWSHSDGTIGAPSDMDFWLLIQNSIMQLLGIFLAVYSLKGNGIVAFRVWRWAVLFCIAGSACSCASIAMYLTMPTFWSGFVSFCGTASQIWTVVILGIVTNPSVKTKQS